MKLWVCMNVGNPRSGVIAKALAEGARRLDWDVVVTDAWAQDPGADLVAGYGWCNHRLFDRYRAAGKQFIYVDLGYWQRKSFMGDFNGYHKVVVDGRHATGYFQRNRPHDRLDGAPEIKPWRRDGTEIVLAGLSPKAAAASGLASLAWEKKMIEEIQAVTDRPIVYRPKPSWADAQPIEGVGFAGRDRKIETVLESAWALVTLHSNAALDAIAAGVPIFAEAGLASAVSMRSIADIEAQTEEFDRHQLLADVGYCHWRTEEIANGALFADLLDQKLVRL